MVGPAWTPRPSRSPADDPRHERLGGGAVETLDLDRKYLDVLHLRVEERHVRRSRERGNDSPHGACRNAPTAPEDRG